MNALVLANFPVAVLVFAAIVGIPLWLTFKRPDRAPQVSATSQYAARQASATPRVPAAGLSLARQHAAASTAVPGRQHTAAARPARVHTAARHDHAAA